MSKTIDYLSPFSPQTAGLLNGPLTSSRILSIADRWRYVLFAFVAVCYIGGFNGQWRMQPDAALYLSIGKNLATGHGFTYLGQTNRLAYPGWPVLISLVFRLFGTASLVPVDLLMIGITWLSLACVYRLFLLHRDRPTAVVMAVGVGLTKAFFCYAFELWSDMPFALGVLAFFAGYEAIVPVRASSPGTRGEGDFSRQTSCVQEQRFSKSEGTLTLTLSRITGRGDQSHRGRWYDWALLVGGLLIAISMRPTALPFVAAIVLGVAVDAIRRRIRWKTIGFIVGGLAVVGLAILFTIHPFQSGFGGVYLDYVHRELTGEDSGLLRRNVGRNVQSLFTWAASDVLFQVRFGPIFNSVLSVVVLALGFRLFRHRAMWGFWFCLLLGTILISQETLDRYFLPVLPLLIFAWWDELVGLFKRLPRPAADLVFLFLLCFGGIVNLTKCCGIVMQQQTRPFLVHYDNGQFETVPAMAAYIKTHVPEEAVIVARAPYGRVISYLSGRAVVSGVDVDLDRARSHPIYILEPTDGPGRSLIENAKLTLDTPAFSSTPAPTHDWKAVPLVLRKARQQ